MIGTGNATCDALATVSFTGNVIPMNWYKEITLPDGKPDLVAITILADVLYWYRPMEVRDERTGHFIGFRKKFKDFRLQRSYAQFTERFGFTKKQSERALKALESIEVLVKDVQPTVIINGKTYSNVMYLDLKVDRLMQISYPQNYTQSNVDKNNDNNSNSYPQNNPQEIHCVIHEDIHNLQKLTGVSPEGERGMSPERETVSPMGETYTEISNTKISYTEKTPPSYVSSMKRIGYDELIKTLSPGDIEVVDGILNLITEIMDGNMLFERVNRHVVPIAVIRAKYMKLTREHIEYVLNVINASTTDPVNPRGYLITLLYNSIATLSGYVKKKANADNSYNDY